MPRLRDGLIVDKVGIRAKREPHSSKDEQIRIPIGRTSLWARQSRAEKRNLSAEGRSEAQRAQRQIQVVGQFELQATEIAENPVLQEYPIPKFAANYFREADLSGLMAL